MSDTLRKVQELIAVGDVEVSDHGDTKLGREKISLREVIAGVQLAVVVEEYPDYAKGPCVLVFQEDGLGKPLHILWGIRKNTLRPAVLVTVYRPDPSRWSGDFLRRQR